MFSRSSLLFSIYPFIIGTKTIIPVRVRADINRYLYLNFFSIIFDAHAMVKSINGNRVLYVREFVISITIIESIPVLKQIELYLSFL